MHQLTPMTRISMHGRIGISVTAARRGAFRGSVGNKCHAERLKSHVAFSGDVIWLRPGGYGAQSQIISASVDPKRDNAIRDAVTQSANHLFA